jgi:hypothetical protein
MTSLELRRMGGSGESGSDADEASEDTTLLPSAKASTGGQRGEHSSSGCCDQCVRRCRLAAGCTVAALTAVYLVLATRPAASFGPSYGLPTDGGLVTQWHRMDGFIMYLPARLLPLAAESRFA